MISVTMVQSKGHKVDRPAPSQVQLGGPRMSQRRILRRIGGNVSSALDFTASAVSAVVVGVCGIYH